MADERADERDMVRRRNRRIGPDYDVDGRMWRNW